MQEQDAESYMLLLKDANLPYDAYKNYDHSKTLQIFDCNKRQHIIKSVSHYDIAGSVIETINNDSKTFDDIVPDSVGERLFKLICK